MLNIDSTRTCYNPDGSTGFQWYWSIDSAHCQEDVRKYRIEMTSSRDNHAIMYYYEIFSSDANSFAVRGNKDYFEGQSVRVRVIAYDSYNQVIARTNEYTLSADGANTNCGNQGVGNSIDWSKMKHHAGVPLSTKNPTYTPVRIIHVPNSKPVLYYPDENTAVLDPVPNQKDVWYTPNRITDTQELVFKTSDGKWLKISKPRGTLLNPWGGDPEAILWIDVYDRDTEWGYWNIVDGTLQNVIPYNYYDYKCLRRDAFAVNERLQGGSCDGDRAQFKVDFLEKNNEPLQQGEAGFICHPFEPGCVV